MARIGIVKAVLQLTPEQAKYWPAVEEAIRARAQAQYQVRVGQPKAVALARQVSPSATAQLMASGFDVTVVPSLNFVSAGTEIALIGTPCTGVQCQDAFFEHHATTYRSLIQTQIS